MNWFKSLWFQTTGTNADTALVDVIHVASEDPEIRQTLLSVLELDAFQRQSALGSMLEQLRLKQAPAQLIGALEALQDDDVAQQARTLLEK